MIDLQSVCHVPDLNWSLSLQDFCQYTAGETKVFPNSLSKWQRPLDSSRTSKLASWLNQSSLNSVPTAIVLGVDDNVTENQHVQLRAIENNENEYYLELSEEISTENRNFFEIIDGQHRFNAFKQLLKLKKSQELETTDFDVPFTLLLPSETCVVYSTEADEDLETTLGAVFPSKSFFNDQTRAKVFLRLIVFSRAGKSSFNLAESFFRKLGT